MKGIFYMQNEKGSSLLELMISIIILPIVLASLLAIFSNTYKANTIEQSKLFINTQEKIISIRLHEQINTVNKWGNISKINRGQTYNWNDIKNELEFYPIDNSNSPSKIGITNNRLMIHDSENPEQSYTEPCIREIRFWADNADNRYVVVRVTMFDPHNPDFPDYTYQESFYAQNLQRT